LVELLHKRKEVAVTPDVKANIFYQVWFVYVAIYQCMRNPYNM